MRIVVLAMGNPILGKDGVGLFVARALKGKIEGADVKTFTEISLEILDILAGYEKVYLIDAVVGVGNNVGDLLMLRPGEVTLHLYSTHGLHFFELLRLGREMGYELPESISTFGIEIGEAISFGENLPPEIARKLDWITDRIAGLIRCETSPCSDQRVLGP